MAANPDDLPELDLVDPGLSGAASPAGPRPRTAATPHDANATEDFAAPRSARPLGAPSLPDALVVVTAHGAAGAHLPIAGLPALERLVRQLLWRGHTRVTVATEVARLPPLPPEVAVRRLEGTTTLDTVRHELGRPVELAGDIVRPRDSDLAVGVRVHDATSRRQAERAVFVEAARTRPSRLADAVLWPMVLALAQRLPRALPGGVDGLVVVGAGVGLLGVLCALGGGYVSLLLGLLLLTLQALLSVTAQTLAAVRYQPGPFMQRVPELPSIVDDGLDVLAALTLAVGIAHRTDSSRVMLLGMLGALLLLAGKAGRWALTLRGEPDASPTPKARARAESAGDPIALLRALAQRTAYLPLWSLLALLGLHRFVVLYLLALGLATASRAGLRLIESLH